MHNGTFQVLLASRADAADAATVAAEATPAGEAVAPAAPATDTAAPADGGAAAEEGGEKKMQKRKVALFLAYIGSEFQVSPPFTSINLLARINSFHFESTWHPMLRLRAAPQHRRACSGTLDAPP